MVDSHFEPLFVCLCDMGLVSLKGISAANVSRIFGNQHVLRVNRSFAGKTSKHLLRKYLDLKTYPKYLLRRCLDV